MAERQLLIFTEQFPFGTSELFLQTELDYLSREFGTIIIVPLLAVGQNIRKLPANVHIDTSFANNRNKTTQLVKSIGQFLASSVFYGELVARWQRILRPRAFKRFLRASLHSYQVQNWLKHYLQSLPNDTHVLCYTYFLTGVSLGIGLAKPQQPKIKLVSRVHGFDVYEDDYPARYIPYQRQALQGLDAIFPISQHALDHLERQHGRLTCFKQVSRLGIKPAGFQNQQSPPGYFSIVSISLLIPLKRICILIDSIAILAKARPDLHFIWHHFGDGVLRAVLEQQAQTSFPANVQWAIKGYRPNSEIFAFYQNQAVDIFVNLSTTEGIPVSIMEAYSCAIPALATEVNGVPEIVTAVNGELLPAAITANDVAARLLQLATSEVAMPSTKRAAAYAMWQKNYNADICYTKFSENLKTS